MRSTTPLVVLLQATSLALAAPAAFRRDQSGPAPVVKATCSQETQDQPAYLHGAVQLCLRMTLPDLATGPLTPSAVQLIPCHDDDSMAAPSAKSASPNDTHGKPPSRVNAKENGTKTAGTKGPDSPKPKSKPANNDARPNKNSNSTHRDPQTNQSTPKTHHQSEGPKHNPSTPGPTRPASSSSASPKIANASGSVTHSATARPSNSPAHRPGTQPTHSTHAPGPSQPAPSSGPHKATPDPRPASNSDTDDDGSGVPRINLDHLQPLVEIKANVKAVDNAKDGTGRFDATEIKDAIQHQKPTDATSLTSSKSIDTVADANASVIKNPGPVDVLGDDQAKATSAKNSATSKVVPQEVSHSPMTETVNQNTSDSTETISKRPADAANASPIHDAARVDVHASATKASVAPLV
ncbi:hypothetical protein M407DRAFT_27657 [Tulasnella calospora MUT 4182]|uniref:EF-hand domain-containing protein n=1 Tax=Tulasnella calospora MUT 4182 TaxID=1051891 RepID=A0A0C3KNF8_9AGAM|nr:hypothetical protein M407DRAFT_27657 [Tulasnella calospora MUT 4182]